MIKEKVTANFLPRPIIMPTATVEPDREMPGMGAMAWARPMARASEYFIPAAFLPASGHWQARVSRIPVTIRQRPSTMMPSSVEKLS